MAATKRSGWDSATIKQRTFSSGSKDSAAADDDRGATAPLNPSSAAAQRESTTTTTTTTTIMTMTIALPATIKSMWAVVLVPHLARCGFNVVVVVTALSCAVRKRANARAFERH